MQLLVEAHCHVQNILFVTIYKLNAQLIQIYCFAITYICVLFYQIFTKIYSIFLFISKLS